MKKPVSPSAGKPPARRPSADADPRFRELREALDDLASLPTEEALDKLDLTEAGAAFEHFTNCEHDTDMNTHSDAPAGSPISARSNSANSRETSKDGKMLDSTPEHFSKISPTDINEYRNIDVLEFSGTLIWFDSSIGFGYISAAESNYSTITITRACLQASGFGYAPPGARMRCAAILRPTETQAFRVISIEPPDPNSVFALNERRSKSFVARSDWMTAVIRWIDTVRRLAFLRPSRHGPELIVLLETLLRHNIRNPRPGQSLRVRSGLGPRGIEVAEIDLPAQGAQPKA